MYRVLEGFYRFFYQRECIAQGSKLVQGVGINDAVLNNKKEKYILKMVMCSIS